MNKDCAGGQITLKNLKSDHDVGYTPYHKRYLLPGGIFVAVFIWTLFELGISPRLFWEGIPHFIRLVSEMFPPNWAVLMRRRVLWSILEVLGMAFLGTFLGSACAFLLALPASASLCQNRAIRTTVKGLLALERTMPSLIIGLLLVVVVGLGPFAGLMTVAIGSIGMLGKLFAEAIDKVDYKTLESLKSVGATKLQIIGYAILPQALPSFIANTLYRFDINLRAALFLGIVGGGGVGFELHLAMSLFRYRDALAITAVTLVIIWLAEQLSNHLRRRIIGRELLQ